jgi:prepilin-type N-terminal cleavage/methylation domain-containing protein
MKLVPAKFSSEPSRLAFTLVELMVAMTVGLILGGTVVYLLVQAAKEQQRGYSDTTVEEKAYMLQANIASCLRGMSCAYGITGSPTNQIVNTNTGYTVWTKIYAFQPNTNGTAFTTCSISGDPVSGAVVYTPNIAVPSSSVVWLTNSANVKLVRFWFENNQNFDLSNDNTLVNVVFELNDNGFSSQNATNNVADIYRRFSIQMRCD